MTDTIPHTQTCPFCYAELDARAVTCGQCQAVKDTRPDWVKRMYIYKPGGLILFIGLFLFIINDGGIRWLGLPFILFGAGVLYKGYTIDLSNETWHRKA